jgi:hypothetical protein
MSNNSIFLQFVSSNRCCHAIAAAASFCKIWMWMRVSFFDWPNLMDIGNKTAISVVGK